VGQAWGSPERPRRRPEVRPEEEEEEEEDEDESYLMMSCIMIIDEKEFRFQKKEDIRERR
jgi:hypothetical protein